MMISVCLLFESIAVAGWSVAMALIGQIFQQQKKNQKLKIFKIEQKKSNWIRNENDWNCH